MPIVLASSPGSPTTLLLEELRTHLVALGLARMPRVEGAEPPMWLEPRNGTPAPGEGRGVEVGPTLVLAAWNRDSVPPGPWSSYQRQDVVELWVRAQGATQAQSLEAQLRIALDDKRAWQMGNLAIIESLLSRGMQLLTSNAQAYTYNLQYRFQRYAPG